MTEEYVRAQRAQRKIRGKKRLFGGSRTACLFQQPHGNARANDARLAPADIPTRIYSLESIAVIAPFRRTTACSAFPRTR